MSEASDRPTPSPAALARQRGGGLSRFIAGGFVWYRVKERASAEDAIDYRSAAQRPEGYLALASVLVNASKLRLRYVGVYEYFGMFGWIPREAWISEDGVTRVSARRGRAGQLEGMMSPYYLSTTFDDGTVLLTWGKSPPPLPSTDGVEAHGGTGDLSVDLAAHEAAVELRRAPGARPIGVESIDDCVALSVHYDRCLTTVAQANGIVLTRVIVWGGILGAIAGVIALLARLVV